MATGSVSLGNSFFAPRGVQMGLADLDSRLEAGKVRSQVLSA